MKKILVIDNYDSFTYNLVYLLRRYAEVTVVKNDKVDIGKAERHDKILFSPGPGIPSEAGQMCELIRIWAGYKPMLGICLGQQAIGEVFGGSLINLSKVFHGIATPIDVIAKGQYLFKDIPNTFTVGRYHSWVVDSKTVPSSLQVTAVDSEGMVMGLSHREFDIHGLQFHPESIMTEYGDKMIENWVNN